jgi:hypothetical protein
MESYGAVLKKILEVEFGLVAAMSHNAVQPNNFTLPI